MLSQYLDQPDMAYISDARAYSRYELGSSIVQYSEEMYDLSDYKIAILGIKESRAAAMKNLGSDIAPDEVRKQLYLLHSGEAFPTVIDLGNIIDAETVSETYEYVENVLSYLYKQEITVLIIGGSQDLTYSQFVSFESSEAHIHLALVDERIDLINGQSTVTSDGYLQHIMTRQHPQLSHLSVFGYQSYFAHPQIISTLTAMNYDTFKLGTVRYSVPSYEHVFRNADMVSIDINALKQSDAPARSGQTPNGFLADELCQIARSAGMSDRVKSLGIYEINPQMDIRHTTAHVAAQALWFFIEGYSYRLGDHPAKVGTEQDYMIYTLQIPEYGETPFHFWHHQQTNHWWIEIPSEREDVDTFYPCSALDYKLCSTGEMSTWVLNIVSRLV